ncbi:MAG: hypothetical protein ABIP41_06795 [Croceibacterium sp.]
MKTALAAGLLLAAATPLLGADDAPLKVQNKGAMTGASRIAIGAFNVGFIFESVDQTKATGGLMGAFGGATKAKSSLVGVTPAMMQQIADAAYADFTGQLQARGLAVADPAAVFGDPAMARAKGDAGPAEINITLEKGSKGKATFYKPTALPVQLMLAGDFLGSGMSSIGRNMQAGQNSAAVATFAKNTGTPVVDVVYLIDFSDQKRPGAFSFSGIKVNANLSVAANFSKMSVVGANGRQNSVTFAKPVAVEGDFIEMADATSGVGRATQTAANIAGGLAAVAGLGGLRFGKTREFTFTAKPGNYEGGAGKAASLANQQLVAQLVAQR